MREGASPLRRRAPRAQRGAALIVMATVLVLGVAWFTVGALGKAAPSAAQREIKTGQALQAAKKALLGYVAQYAARTDFNFPGRMPCPESPSSIGTANEGVAANACSNTSVEVGRLPWRTLGIDRLRDGDGEPLWYVLSPNFRPTTFPLNPTPPDPWLNFDTPPQLPFDGGSVVAVLIAPGRAMNTLSDPATPPAGCIKVNQQVANRYVAALNAANFFECGNASGSYENRGTSQWTNDRVIPITLGEWQDAIAGPVADRLQRQVAVALSTWDQTEQTIRGKSWGGTWGFPYMPYASSFGDPSTNDYCGNAGAREGLLPVASVPPGAPPAVCDTRWSGNGSVLGGLIPLPCVQDATELRCPFLRLLGALLPASVTATAPIGNAFRGTIRCPLPYNPFTCDIGTSGGTVTAISMAMDNATAVATLTVQVQFPPLPFLAIANIRVPYVPDALVLSDPSVVWFRANNWHRFTYYGVALGQTANSATPCAAQGGAGCLEALGVPAETFAPGGNYWNKRFALVLAGLPLPGQNRGCPVGCADLTQYVEGENAVVPLPGAARRFRASYQYPNPAPPAPPYPAFNDRLTACPFKYVDSTGADVTLCN